MLTKCSVCGSYDVSFYETIEAAYYCDGCMREQGWYDSCIETSFRQGYEDWCHRGYWLESQADA